MPSNLQVITYPATSTSSPFQFLLSHNTAIPPFLPSAFKCNSPNHLLHHSCLINCESTRQFCFQQNIYICIPLLKKTSNSSSFILIVSPLHSMSPLLSLKNWSCFPPPVSQFTIFEIYVKGQIPHLFRNIILDYCLSWASPYFALNVPSFDQSSEKAQRQSYHNLQRQPQIIYWAWGH